MKIIQAEGTIFNGLPATISFKSVGLDSHQTIDSKAVELYLHAGGTVDAKIIKVNQNSCIVSMKLHLNRDDAKLYLSENKILIRYSLIDNKNFRVVLDEDFPFQGICLEHLKKSSQVKYARNTKNRLFRNWNIFECRKELQTNVDIDVNFN